MIDRLFDWLDKSTSNFMAIKTIGETLIANGYKELKPEEHWNLEAGKKYFIKKNETALLAFLTPDNFDETHGFRIIASHSDSPCFKIKPNPEIYSEGLISLNVEKYGGGINFTWFDRPLSFSGRVVVKGNAVLNPETIVFDYEKPFAVIPNLAIHFNRSVNDGFSTSVQKDMKPIIGYFSKEEIEAYKKRGGIVKSLIAEKLGIQPEDILDYELSLYPKERASLCGVHNEFFQSGRIDDLSMVFASLEALLENDVKNCKDTRLVAIFDNEETGSGTKQGAASPFLRNVMERIILNFSHDKEGYYRALANTFMISADDAHAWNPNYNEKYDPTNHPVIGGGPVIKINSNCKYMTDSQSAAVFRNLCEKAGVKYQYFVNHADVAGGSTLGNILTSNIDINGVDVGNPIWAMHSERETAGVSDHLDMVKVFSLFFSL